MSYRPSLSVSALGAFQLARQGAGSPKFKYLDSREVLVFLLLSSDDTLGKSKQEIGAVLWGDLTAAQLNARFKARLNDIRHTLGAREWIVFQDEAYRFDLEQRVWFDVREFKRNCAEAETARRAENSGAEREALRRAIALYRGDFMQGYHTRRSKKLYGEREWYLTVREELQHKYRGTLERAAQLEFDAGRLDGGIELLRTLVALDEYDDDAHRQLMLALVRQGERSRALRHFQNLVKTRVDVVPDAELSALFEKIKRNEDLGGAKGNQSTQGRTDAAIPERMLQASVTLRRELPSGTLTVLFTDIEGSTKLWQQFPTAMPVALAHHHELLRESIEHHNGYVFQIIGDAFCATFATASDGLDAALAAQRALRAAIWGETGELKVRMALHTGALEVRPGDFTSGEYVSGITLSRAARLLSAGHGSQILLSASTAELVREALPPRTALREMGAHRLKDLVQPQYIFQVLAPDLQEAFPPLKTVDGFPNNLPIQPTSFIGREQELADLRRLSGKTHLLTLIGAGGSGKTRLSLQFAAEVIHDFKNGAWFIELAGITDSALVPNAVLNALALREDAGHSALEVVTDFLRAKTCLLLLDNCEHLVNECARFAHHVLTHCPDVRIHATSREALGVAGELTYQVPTLALPDPKRLPTLESLSQYDAVRLFIERALAMRPDFAVTNANAPAVAQICYRLDGIPLAIELAAARIKLFSPEQISTRLDDRLRLLAAGSRTAVPRQQTLRGAIDWSYSLLSEGERILFRRLAVFAGGWTFEAAEQVCAGRGIEELDILELLAQLVNKSLVTTELRGAETRYRLLETIREYASEKLKEAGETDALRTQHLDYFVGFAEQGESHLKRPEQFEWLERLDSDVDNFRAALEWSLGAGRVERGLRLGAALYRYWDMRANWREPIGYLENLLRQPEAAARTIARANVLLVLAVMEMFLGKYPLSGQHLEETIEIAREQGERGKPLLAESLAHYSDIAFYPTLDVWQARANEGLAIARSLDDAWLIGFLLFFQGHLFTRSEQKDFAHGREMYKAAQAHFSTYGDYYWADVASYQANITYFREGDCLRARQGIEPTVELSRKQKNRDMVVLKLYTLGDIARTENDFALAQRYYAEALDGAREIGGLGWTFDNLCSRVGNLALYDGRLETARKLFIEGLESATARQEESWVVFALIQLANLAAAEKRALQAVQLYGFGDHYIGRQETEFLDQIDKTDLEHFLALARNELGEQEFSAAWEQGRALTLEQAIELALSDV